MKIEGLKRFTELQRDARLCLASVPIVLFTNGISGVVLNVLLLRPGYGTEFVGLVSGTGALIHAGDCPLSGVLTRWP
jgi:hypothetical protein